MASKTLETTLRRILSTFPQDYSFAFAYGSGVYEQAGNSDMQKKMLDLIITVDDPLKWHSENLKNNKWHYSMLRFGGPNLVTRIQKNLGAGIYFNTLIPFENRHFKYGVISTAKLRTDLLDWETLYVSGRLHKPVKILHAPTNSFLKAALKVNLQSALHTVLLQLPEAFTENELYLQLAGLSFCGDFRMLLGEDPRKVENIVQPQVDEFREIYAPHILSMKQVLHWDQQALTLEQDCTASARLHHLNLLPKQLQSHLVLTWNKDGRQQDLEDVLKAAAQDVDCPEMVSDGVGRIVRRSSWSQSLKGILTAGIWKSLRYGGAKLNKMIKAVKR